MRYIKMDLIGGPVYAKVVYVTNREPLWDGPLVKGMTIGVEFDNGTMEYYHWDDHFEEVSEQEFAVGKVMAS